MNYFDKFKQLTGLNGGDVEARFSLTRQYWSQLLKNRSLTHKAAAAFIIITLIDEVISAKKREIEQLEELKFEISREVGRGGE